MLLAVDCLAVERGGRMVLSGLSFSLSAGDLVHVSGHNGAGKSTLLRAVAGLLPIHGGRVTVAGADDEVRGAETMHYLGYEDALKPALTVEENLAFWAAMLAAPSSSRDVARGVRPVPPRDALRAFGLARLIDLPAAYLSAGQKRRVALARLLLNPRPVWLLDEPSIALDAAAQDILTAAMAEHAARGGAIMVASHTPLGLPCRTLDLGGVA